MIIILGFDNTGKTTLVEDLQKDLKLPVVNSFGVGKEHEQLMWTINQVESPELSIYERFTPFEEIVYGPILREDSHFHLSDFIFEKIQKNPHLVVYCRPSREEIFGNIDGRPQMDGVVKFKETLLKRFDDLYFEIASDPKYKTVCYDWTKNESYFNVFEKAVKIKKDWGLYKC